MTNVKWQLANETRSKLRIFASALTIKLLIPDSLDYFQVHGPPRRPPGGQERDRQHNRQSDQDDLHREREWDRVTSDHRSRSARQEVGVEDARDRRRHDPDDADHHGFEQDHLT